MESKKAWEAYQNSIHESLILGSDPRGWIVASTSLFATSEHPLDPVLLAKASDAAPNDMFVQFMVTALTSAAAPVWQAAQARLEKGAPENGAVWLNALNTASSRNDEVAIDRALDAFARSTRFDSRQIALTREMVAAFASKPMPDLYFPDSANLPQIRKELIGPAVSYMRNSMVFGVAPNSLSKECAPERSSDTARRLNCELSLRLMLSSADTFLMRQSAASLMRKRQELTEADNETVRNNDWQYFQLVHADGDPNADIEARSRKIDMFLEAGNEIDGMQRYMATADIAMSAPMDWKDIFVPKPKKLSTEKSAAPN